MKQMSLVFIGSVISLLVAAQTYRAKKYITPDEKLNNEYCTGLFKTYDGTILDLEDEMSVKGYSNILEWLKGRVAGFEVAYLKNGLSIPLIRHSRAAVFIDEVPLDPQYIGMISVNDIAMIKIVRQPVVSAIGHATGGAILIYTFKGEEEEEVVD